MHIASFLGKGYMVRGEPCISRKRWQLSPLELSVLHTWQDFTQVVRRPWLVALGATLQYTVMPLMGFAVSRLLNLPLPYAVGCGPPLLHPYSRPSCRLQTSAVWHNSVPVTVSRKNCFDQGRRFVIY